MNFTFIRQILNTMPLLVAAIAILLGIILGQYLGAIAAIIGGLLCFLALGLTLILLRKTFSIYLERASLLFILLTCFFAGVVLIQISRISPTDLPFSTEKEVAIVGIISSDVKHFEKMNSAQLTTIGYYEEGQIHPWQAKLQLRIDSAFHSQIEKHDSVYLTANVKPLKSKNESYLRYQNRNGIFYVAYPKMLAVGQKNVTFLYKIEQLQQQFSKRFLALMPDSAMAGIANAMFLGENEFMDDKVSLDYKNTGVSHILSISGQHISVIFMLLNLMFIPLGTIKGGKNGKNVIILALLLIYMLLCGAGASVVRSVSMFVVILIAKLFRKRYHILNLLGFAAILQMIWDPLVVYNLGFQLSYAAVASIVIFFPLFEQQFMTQHKWLNVFFSWIGVTLTAQILTFPILILNFGTFPTYFLVANVLLALVAQLTVFCGFIFLLVCYIPLLDTIFAYLTHLGLSIMTYIVHKIALLPYPIIDNLQHKGILILLGTLAFTAFLLYLPKWISKEKANTYFPEGLTMWGLD